MKHIELILGDLLASGSFWLPLALIAAMILTNGLKAVVKHSLPVRTFWRTVLIFLLAYGCGYITGYEFLSGPDVHKWSILLGLFNPIVYIGLVEYSIRKNKPVMLAMLKARVLDKTPEGNPAHHETQRFMSK